MKNALKLLREEIDVIDQEIIDLLSMRMKLVRQVGEYKEEKGIPPLDRNRWQNVLDTKIALAKKLGLDSEMIHDIYQRIHKSALELESQIVKKTDK